MILKGGYQERRNVYVASAPGPLVNLLMQHIATIPGSAPSRSCRSIRILNRVRVATEAFPRLSHKISTMPMPAVARASLEAGRARSSTLTYPSITSNRLLVPGHSFSTIAVAASGDRYVRVEFQEELLPIA